MSALNATARRHAHGVRVPRVSHLGRGASAGVSTSSILCFDAAFSLDDAVEGTSEGAPFAGGLVDVLGFEIGAFEPAGQVFSAPDSFEVVSGAFKPVVRVFAAPDAFEVVGAFVPAVFVVDDAGLIADVFDEADIPGPGVFAIDVPDGVGVAGFEEDLPLVVSIAHVRSRGP
jgi:hypothetical protein